MSGDFTEGDPTTELRPTHPDRLELGEGVRWTADGCLVLVDILAGRFRTAPDEPAAPLQELAQLPVPLGALFTARVDVPGSPATAHRPSLAAS
ncbi:hypothetical protein OHB14_52515 [Streptomyces sp. NBC_01613]|uniref:hypothetical protein n=1 Tax=Streptomyces sp. NBC_01613 TaxID=2975896 RepID=UPI0038698409